MRNRTGMILFSVFLALLVTAAVWQLIDTAVFRTGSGDDWERSSRIRGVVTLVAGTVLAVVALFLPARFEVFRFAALLGSVFTLLSTLAPWLGVEGGWVETLIALASVGVAGAAGYLYFDRQRTSKAAGASASSELGGDGQALAERVGALEARLDRLSRL